MSKEQVLGLQSEVEAAGGVGGVPDMVWVPAWAGEHIVPLAESRGRLLVGIAGGTGPRQWTVTTEDEDGYEIGECLQIGLEDMEALGQLFLDMAQSYRAAHPERGEKC